MNFRSARIWAHLSSLDRSNCRRSLRTKRAQTKLHGRFRSKSRMVRRSWIQQIPAQYWIRFSVQSTRNLNTSVEMRKSTYWIPSQFVNQQMSGFQATSIQFQACPELCFWRARSGASGSSCRDGFRMLICQELWWRMKWVLERLSPRLQWQCFANWWLTKLKWCCHCPFYGGIPLKSVWFWQTMTFPALSVKNGSGNRSRDWILCPATCWRSRQHCIMAIQHLYQPLNLSRWCQWPQWQRCSRLSLMRWHMEPISNSSTCFTPKMEISRTRIWTPVLMSRKTDGISTFCRKIS